MILSLASSVISNAQFSKGTRVKYDIYLLILDESNPGRCLLVSDIVKVPFILVIANDEAVSARFSNVTDEISDGSRLNMLKGCQKSSLVIKAEPMSASYPGTYTINGLLLSLIFIILPCG